MRRRCSSSSGRSPRRSRALPPRAATMMSPEPSRAVSIGPTLPHPPGAIVDPSVTVRGQGERAMRRVLIAGAGGRDFHTFNVVFRDDPDTEVVAFTATQIPNIDNREYPTELAGPRYPKGIPIRPESELETIVDEQAVDEVVFAYSDVAYADVMHVASRAMAAGADFRIVGPNASCLRSRRPV